MICVCTLSVQIEILINLILIDNPFPNEEAIHSKLQCAALYDLLYKIAKPQMPFHDKMKSFFY